MIPGLISHLKKLFVRIGFGQVFTQVTLFGYSLTSIPWYAWIEADSVMS